MHTLTYSVIPFKSLTTVGLYNILYMREQVFQIEQNCIYQDIDGMDVSAFHLLGYDETNELVAYCRLLPPNIPFQGCYSIGRVLTIKKARGNGYGRQIMNEAIRILQEEDKKIPIMIGAQTYLQKFYESLGFVIEGESYDEDGIEHIRMLYQKQN